MSIDKIERRMHMIKEEWKSLWKSTWFKIVLCAIILIPTIYASVFLGSMWDPYGNADSIPVAVVNLDKEVNYNGETLHVGDELVKNLKENKAMDFRFVNQQEANQGLQDGKYYMKITIPSNFSSCATTLLDEKPEKMVLEYTTNPGTNYIASKMDESAISKIKENISANVTKTYATTIFDQIMTLSSGLKEASDGTGTIYNGVTHLINGNNTISNNLQVLSDSSLTFKEGTKTLEVGLTEYLNGVTAINRGAGGLREGVSTLYAQAPTLIDGVEQLQSGATQLQEGTIKYTGGVQETKEGIGKIISNNDAINGAVINLSSGIATLNTSSDTVYKVLKQSANKLKTELEASASDLETLQIANTNIATNSTDLISKVQSDNTKIQTAVTIINNSTSLSSVEKEAILEALTASQSTNSVLIGDGSATNPGLLASMENVSTKNNTAILGLTSSLNDVKDGLYGDGTATNPGALVSLDTINTKYKGVEQLLKTSLQPSLQEYTNGVKTVNDGLTEINNSSNNLVVGSAALSQGMDLIIEKAPLLTDGINQLQTGASSLETGTNSLVKNNSKLLDGIRQLSFGSVRISDGAGQLATGSNALGQGLSQVEHGTNILNISLLDGANKSNIQVKNDTFDMIASPVNTKHQEISTVENNGHAMAPYMMSVALYVAAMAFTLMYPLLNNIKEAKSGLKYWMSKASIMYSVSTIQAVVMIGLLMIINGLQPEQILETFLFACLVSAAFMSIIVFFNITLGKVGSFLILVFMVLQLGGAAGTYPLETSSNFYKLLHPLMPFSYSVDGFRHVLSMQNFVVADALVFIGILVVFSTLSIIFYQYRSRHPHTKLKEAFD